MNRYAQIFERRPPLAGLVVITFTLLACWGHWRGEVSPWKTSTQDAANNSPDSVGSDVEQLASEQFIADEPAPDDAFSSDAFLVVDGENLFTKPKIGALRTMVQAVEDLPQVQSLLWVDEVPLLNMFGVPEPLIPADDAPPELFDEAKSNVLSHPLAAGQLVSTDGNTLLMPLQYDWLSVTEHADCTQAVLSAARSQLAASGSDGIRVRITGDVPIYIAQHESLEKEQVKFQVIGYGMAIVVTVWLFRGFSAVLIVAAAPALAIFWSLGVLNLLGEATNTLTSVILPVLVSMVGLTDGVHLMMHLRRERSEGLNAAAAGAASIRRVGTACALTSLTTAIGFGSLLLSHAEFIRSFGKSCAVGVLLSFIAVITVIPYLSWTRLGRNVHRGYARDIISRKMLGNVAFVDWVMEHPRRVTALGVCVTILLGLVSLTLRPDNRLKNSLPSNGEMFDALAHCDEAFGGIETASVVIRWPDDVTAYDPLVYRIVSQVQAIVDDEPLLRHTLSIRNLLQTFPQQRGSLADRMQFLDLLPPPLKQLFFDDASRRTEVMFRVQDVGIAKYEPVFRRVEKKLARLSDDHPGFAANLEGDAILRGRDLYRIVLDLAKSLGFASVVIFLVIMFMYRSLRLGLIALVPNLFPLGATASVLVLMGGALDFASVCSFTVCLGIAVDDTIHFLTRYQQELKNGRTQKSAIRETYLKIGTALATTTFIMVLGFGTALTSELPDHRMFAGMACATIGAALVADLVFLPAMLVCFDRPKAQTIARDDRPLEAVV